MSAVIEMEATELIASLKNVTKNLTKELGIVAGKTGRRAKSIIAKEVTTELAVKQKTVRDNIVMKQDGKTAVTVDLNKTKRIPLRDFGARQTKKGVSYRISKSQGRKTVVGAFQGPRPGVMRAKWKGRVFKRVGKERLPIRQLRGPSPWGVFVKKGMTARVIPKINAELRKQLGERIRYKTLKKRGTI